MTATRHVCALTGCVFAIVSPRGRGRAGARPVVLAVRDAARTTAAGLSLLTMYPIGII